MRGVSAFIMFILVFTMMPSASTAQSEPSPKGIIAFASTSNGESSIYTIRPDGTGLRKVIANGSSPSFTPGGGILFARGRDIYSVNVSGAGLTRWTHHKAGTRISNPIMSEDRELILFNATISPASTPVVRIFNTRNYGESTLDEGSDPSLTPDQVLILFARQNQIYYVSRSKMSEDPFKPRLMWEAKGTDQVHDPVYGPGEFNGLIYTQLGPTPAGRWTLHAVLYGRGDKPKDEVLATNASQPAFSPDGRFIAFIRNGDLYLMRADGSQQRLVTRGPGELSHPAFSSR